MSELTVQNISSEVGNPKTAMDYIIQSKSQNTRIAYRKDWHAFVTFCEAHNLDFLPATPKTVGEYITALANKGRKVSTIKRYLASISQAHQTAGKESPTRTTYVRDVVKGITHEHGTAPNSKKAARLDDIRKMVNKLGDRLIDIRNRAILLVGFAGAFRRSELVGLNVEDLEFTRDGIVIQLRKSKTDQGGEGRKIGIPYGSHRETCPVRAVQDWINASAIQTGALFRSIDRHGNLLGQRADHKGTVYSERLSDKAVALVVKQYAKAAGLGSEKYAGHSLRSGFATTAAESDVNERDIMRQTGHKSVQMVRRYIQEGSLFKNNAAAEIGL